jgi:hypothetical protein
MISITTRSGRPFVELLTRLTVSPDLIRAALKPQTSPASAVTMTVSWEGRRSVVRLVSTRQRLGGHRWWFQCPRCRKRRGVLLGSAPDVLFACRACWRAVYMTAFPGRRWYVPLRQLLGTLPGGPLDVCNELDRLAAKRRRGVRRGRRVHERALRLLSRYVRQPWGERVGEYWSRGGKSREAAGTYGAQRAKRAEHRTQSGGTFRETVR